MSESENCVHNFPIRELSPERDLAVWLNLIHAVEREDRGSERTTEEDLRRTLNWPRMRRWVVEIPGKPGGLVAYGLLFAQILERSAVEVAVHPGWRQKGLGSRLLTFLIEEAKKSGAECAYDEIADANTGDIAFAQRNGFSPAGDVWVLRAGAGVNFDCPVWPEGYSVRSFAEVGDIELLVQACNRGFGDLWSHHENTAGGVTAEELGGWLKSWDPDGIFLTFAPDGSPIGSCRVEVGEEEDLVDEPGVAPEHRHLQLQLPMVLKALAWLRKQGRKPVRLESWGDSQETVEIYKSIGFELTEHAVSMRYGLG